MEQLICNGLIQSSESLFYFLMIPWCRRWAKQSPLQLKWNQLLKHSFGSHLFYDSLIAQWEVNTFFPFLAAVVVCCQTWLTPCFHWTHPCGVCFLWGFRAPVEVLDGGCWRLAGVECGSWGRPRQMGLAFGRNVFVSERWFGFLPCLYRLVFNQTGKPDSGSDSNKNQMVTREDYKKWKREESERKKLFLWWLEERVWRD